jgi:uncharacterized protein (TIGR02466 family)
MNRDLWFPTAAYHISVTNHKELNASFLKHIKKWRKKDPGLNKTNSGGWHSPINMHTKEEYKPLVKELQTMQEAVCREEGYTKPMFIGNMWANINYPGCFNRTHLHPNCPWSGVYYIQTPKDCGNLYLEDPRHGSNMFLPKQLPIIKIPSRLWKQVEYPPREGKLLIFPAFLSHHVGINYSKQKGEKGWRVSVSFNLVQQ